MQDIEFGNRDFAKAEKMAGGEGFEPSQSEPESDVPVSYTHLTLPTSDLV